MAGKTIHLSYIGIYDSPVVEKSISIFRADHRLSKCGPNSDKRARGVREKLNFYNGVAVVKQF